jgi:hypothetical protein
MVRIHSGIGKSNSDRTSDRDLLRRTMASVVPVIRQVDFMWKVDKDMDHTIHMVMYYTVKGRCVCVEKYIQGVSVSSRSRR